jgi:hypothetical protein
MSPTIENITCSSAFIAARPTPLLTWSVAALLLGSPIYKGTCEAETPGYLYWSTVASTGSNPSDSKIKRARLDGSAPELIITVPASGRFGGIAFDPDNGFLYSGDGATLFRANLDGTGRTVLVTNTAVTDVEIDLAHGKVYWSDNLRDVINRANLDGSGAETILTLNFVDNVEGLALDPLRNRFFFTYGSSPAASSIKVANLDGSGVSTFKSLPSSAAPFDVEMDTTTGRLYWNEYGANPNQMSRTLIDGSGPVQSVFTLTNRFRNGFYFDMLDQKFYYGEVVNDPTNGQATLVFSRAADGSTEQLLFSEPEGLNYIELIRPKASLAVDLYAGLSIRGQIGANYQIQYSTNLNNPAVWMPLTNITLLTSPYLFIDPTPAHSPARFYRALLIP